MSAMCRVVAPLVVSTDENGGQTYTYEGGLVALSDAEAERLTRKGFVVAVEPEPKKAAPRTEGK